MENLHCRSKAPKFSPQQLVKGRGSFENADLDSTFFLRYLRGSLSPPSPIDGVKHRRNRHLSPLSPVENLMAVARSPQPREEVLVMDGVLVTGGGKRSSKSWSGGSNSPSVASSDSSGKSFYKGQFVHGKENLHHTRYSGKNKSEAQICKSTPSPGSCTPSPKSRFGSLVMSSAVTEAASSSPKPNGSLVMLSAVTEAAAASPKPNGSLVMSSAVTEAAASSPKPNGSLVMASAVTEAATSSPKPNGSLVMASAVTEAAASSPKPNSTSKIPITVMTCKDWSPQDDGIEVVLPSSTYKPPSKEELDAYINDFLFGLTAKRRLPVFAEITSE